MSLRPPGKHLRDPQVEKRWTKLNTNQRQAKLKNLRKPVFFFINRPASNHYHHGTQRVETTTYCISQANHGEDILRVETTYETDQKQSLTRHTITQKLYDKPMRRTPSDKSRASVSWQVPDLQLITSSPVKQRKQPKSKIDRNLLVVPARQKKKSPD